MARELLPSGLSRRPEHRVWHGKRRADLSGHGDVLPLQDAQAVPGGHDDCRYLDAGQCDDAGLGLYRHALCHAIYPLV